MANRFHYWQFLVDNSGVPISGADVTVRIAGKNIYGDLANIYTSENGNTLSPNSVVSTTSNGYFEFWIASSTQDSVFGYDISTKFCIQWSKGGSTSGYIDYIDIVKQYITSIDVNSDDIRTDKTISNTLAKKWNNHVDSTMNSGVLPHGLLPVSEELYYRDDDADYNVHNRLLSNHYAYNIDRHMKSQIENINSFQDVPDVVYYMDEVHGIKRPLLNGDVSKRKFFLEGDNSRVVFFTQGILENLENISHNQVSSDSGIDYHTQYILNNGSRAFTNTPYKTGNDIGTILDSSLHSNDLATNHLVSVKWLSKQLFGYEPPIGGSIAPVLDTIYINKTTGGTIVGNVLIDGDLIVTGDTNVLELNEATTTSTILTLNSVDVAALDMYKIPTTYKSGLRLYRGVAETSGVVKISITVDISNNITGGTIVTSFAGLGYTVGNVIAIDNGINTDPLFFVKSVGVNGDITEIVIIQNSTGGSFSNGQELDTYLYNNGLLYNYELYYDEISKKLVGGYVLANGQILEYVIDNPSIGVADNTYYKDDIYPSPVMIKVDTVSPLTYTIITYGNNYVVSDPVTTLTLKQYNQVDGEFIVSGETIDITVSRVTSRTEYMVNPVAFVSTTYENSIPFWSNGLLTFDSIFVYKNGNLGINNANPLYKFCATGDSHFDGNVGIGANPSVSDVLTVSGIVAINDIRFSANNMGLKNIVDDRLVITASSTNADNLNSARIELYNSTGNMSIHSGLITNSRIDVYTYNTRRFYINNTGIIPNTTEAYDLGSSSVRYRAIYTKDLTATGTISSLSFISTNGYYFTETGNDTGFYSGGNGIIRYKLDNVYNGEFSTTSTKFLANTLQVGNGVSSSIIMTDTDNGNRTIHCNDNKIGFHIQASATFGSYCNDDGSWSSDFYMTAPYFKANAFYFKDNQDDNVGFYSITNDKVSFISKNIECGYFTDALLKHNGYMEANYFNSVSKREFKDNIVSVDYSALDIMDSVDVVSFTFKEDVNSEYKVGFIADDTDKILSGKNQDKMDINNCIGLLIKSVQELREENRKLKMLLS